MLSSRATVSAALARSITGPIWVVPTYDIVYDISVNVSETITHIGVTIVTIIL